MCGAPRTRWVHRGAARVPACVSCYCRERYEPKRRKVLAKSESTPDVRVAKKAALMLRRGAPWTFVCEKTGVSKRTLLMWMGRCAATESF